jgi:hypothetical protein
MAIQPQVSREAGLPFSEILFIVDIRICHVTGTPSSGISHFDIGWFARPEKMVHHLLLFARYYGRDEVDMLFTVLLSGCIAIGGCPDQGSLQSGREHLVQGQSNKGSGRESGGQGSVRSACKTEIEKFCSGEAQAGRCLRNRNPEELSEQCKAALANRGSR